MSTTENTEETPVLTEEIDNLQMSRGEKPEPCDFKFNFAKARDMYVLDEGGNKIRFGDIYKHQKTIIVFSRVWLYIFIFQLDLFLTFLMVYFKNYQIRNYIFCTSNLYPILHFGGF